MATKTEESDPDPSRTEIREAIDKAEKAIRKHDYQRQWAASKDPNSDPDENADVRAALIELNTGVYLAFRKMRPYIKRELPEYWKEAAIYDVNGEAIMPQKNDDGELVQEAGLQLLEVWEGKIETRTFKHNPKHGRERTETQYIPVLLPVESCRRVVSLLEDCFDHLDLGAQVSERKPIHKLNANGS